MTAGERPSDDNSGTCRVLSDSLGAAPALDGDAGLSESDSRVLPVQLDETTSERWRGWKSLAGMISEPLFPDWPLEGPRTTKWLVEEIAKSGGGPLQHHQRWRTQLRADVGNRSVHEHELLCMTLELSGCYDQLDLSVLAGIELVVRRLQPTDPLRKRKLCTFEICRALDTCAQHVADLQLDVLSTSTNDTL